MSSGDKPASLSALRAEARHCTACPLYQHATQTVFGVGNARAHVMLIGETPGDREDAAHATYRTGSLRGE